MLILVCLLASLIPLSEAFASKGCWASSQKQECLYDDTVLQGREGLMISYYLKIPFSRICCEALSCTLETGRCQFEFAGCHGNSSLAITHVTRPRPWELPNIPIMMRCNDVQGNGAFYWFWAKIVQKEYIH